MRPLPARPDPARGCLGPAHLPRLAFTVELPWPDGAGPRRFAFEGCERADGTLYWRYASRAGRLWLALRGRDAYLLVSGFDRGWQASFALPSLDAGALAEAELGGTLTRVEGGGSTGRPVRARVAASPKRL